MTTALETTTAQIIPFPVGGVRRLRDRIERPEVKLQADTTRYSDLAFGGCWYHEEAVAGPSDPKGKLS